MAKTNKEEIKKEDDTLLPEPEIIVSEANYIKERLDYLIKRIESSYETNPSKELYDILIDLKVTKKAANLLA